MILWAPQYLIRGEGLTSNLGYIVGGRQSQKCRVQSVLVLEVDCRWKCMSMFVFAAEFTGSENQSISDISLPRTWERKLLEVSFSVKDFRIENGAILINRRIWNIRPFPNPVRSEHDQCT